MKTPKRHYDADHIVNYYNQKGTLLVNLDYIRNRIEESCLSYQDMEHLEHEILLIEEKVKSDNP